MKAAKAKAERKVRKQKEVRQRRKIAAKSEARRATQEERPTHYCPCYLLLCSCYCFSVLPVPT